MIRFFGDHAISTLQSKKMKVAKPSELNDPFDFLLEILDDTSPEVLDDLVKNEDFLNEYGKWLVREAEGDVGRASKLIEPSSVSRLYKSMTKRRCNGDNNFRLLCFNDPYKIDDHGLILMWSHYGNEHKGVCIYFDYNHLTGISQVCKPVNYPPTEERVVLHPKEAFNQDSCIAKLKSAIFTKSPAWAYEQEKRMLVPLAKEYSLVEHDIQSGMDFVPFPVEAVTSVDVGMKANNDFKRKLFEVLSHEEYAHVNLRQAKMHDTKYEIEYDPISVEDLNVPM